MKFTIIAAHYQGVTNEVTLRAFIQSLEEQTYKDFELILIHDGPLTTPIEIETNIDMRVLVTKERANCWGHNLRQIGLDNAKGELILHTNSDNVYYPEALDHINQASLEHVDTEVFICKVWMMGMNCINSKIWYDIPRDFNKKHLLTANPPVFGNMDMMQVVISKNIWDSIGGWRSTEETSDGVLYEIILEKNDYVYVNTVIGEHY